MKNMCPRNLLLLLVAAVVATVAVAARPTSFDGNEAPSKMKAFKAESLQSLQLAPLGGMPSWCRGIDCPSYAVVEKTAAYEGRRYAAAKWMSTIVTGMDYDKAINVGFMRLFHYIGGDNDKKSKVAMTAPVRVRVIPGAGPFCESNFTVSFFVPFAKGSTQKQISPPTPTDPEVFEDDIAETVVYVSEFGGRPTIDDILKKADDLGDALEKDGKAFTHDHFVSAGYDPPFKIFNRHNEVWFFAADSSQQDTAAAATSSSSA